MLEFFAGFLFAVLCLVAYGKMLPSGASRQNGTDKNRLLIAKKYLMIIAFNDDLTAPYQTKIATKALREIEDE